MKRYEPEEGERIVIVEEKRSSDIGALLLGLAVGAGLGLLLAPRPGVETRQAIRRRLRAARHAAGETAGDVAERVTGSFSEAREEIERRIEAARAAVSRRTNQLADAVAAGRSAARRADSELRAQLVDAGAPPRGFAHRPTRMPPRRAPRGAPRRGPRPGSGDLPKRSGAPDHTEE
jgi:gas vesicle protein